MPHIVLPTADRCGEPYVTVLPREFPAAAPPRSRMAYAAVHVVADPLRDRAELLCNPDLACGSMRHLLAVQGVV